MIFRFPQHSGAAALIFSPCIEDLVSGQIPMEMVTKWVLFFYNAKYLRVSQEFTTSHCYLNYLRKRPHVKVCSILPIKNAFCNYWIHFNKFKPSPKAYNCVSKLEVPLKRSGNCTYALANKHCISACQMSSLPKLQRSFRGKRLQSNTASLFTPPVFLPTAVAKVNQHLQKHTISAAGSWSNLFREITVLDQSIHTENQRKA